MSPSPPEGAEVFDPAGSVLVDRVGAVAAIVGKGTPDQGAVLLDIGGRVNNTVEQQEHRYLMVPGQVAELVAVLTLAATAVMAPDEFMAEMTRALERERERAAGAAMSDFEPLPGLTVEEQLRYQLEHERRQHHKTADDLVQSVFDHDSLRSQLEAERARAERYREALDALEKMRGSFNRDWNRQVLAVLSEPSPGKGER